MEIALRLDEIIEVCSGKLIQGDRSDLVAEVSTDTRTLKGGELFIALQGKNFDGHDFVAASQKKGAIGAVISKRLESPIKNLIWVNDTLEALGEIASAYRAKFSLPIVAVTGSNGKTTTKEMIASLLSQKFEVLKSEKSLNNRIGIPMAIFKLSKKHEIGVLELGTSLWGEIPALTKVVAPEVGVITNIAPTHLEELGSVERVAEEKAAILSFAKHAVLNFDDPIVSQMGSNFRGDIIGFGMDNSAQVRAKGVKLDKEGRPSFEILINDLSYGEVQLPCLGLHNVYNALAAAAVGFIFKLEPEQIKTGLENYQPSKMRMQSEEIAGVRFINDAYNANPVSMKAAIEFLSQLNLGGSGGRKIAVLGSMAELGESSKQFHRDIGEFFSKLGVNLLICVGSEASHIASAAMGSGFSKESTFEYGFSSEAGVQLFKLAKSGDIVLVKGSRSMRLEEAIGKFRELASEKT